MPASPTFPIVGAFFRPPAQALLDSLAIGTPLFLWSEPENAYDINAVAVYLNSADLGEAAKLQLESTLSEFGYTVDQIMAAEIWHLGYIDRKNAAYLRERNIVPEGAGVEVKFLLSPDGKPRIQFLEPVD